MKRVIIIVIDALGVGAMPDAEKYGDDRRSPIVKRQEAKVIKQETLLPAELITVILSSNGWIRAAKGHEINSKN